MAGYTKLFSKILNSSIWNENDKTRILWITMLAMCDQHGFVEGAPSSLAHQARISKEDFDKAILVLESPDPESMTSDFEGRRVAREEGGWIVLNYDKYRNKTLDSKENEQSRERVKRYRERQKSKQFADNQCNGVTSVTLRNPASASASSSASTMGESEGDYGFAEFWKAYPKHKAKAYALKCWLKHKPDLATCLEAISWQKETKEWKKEEGAFIPYPATWINKERWTDEKPINNKKDISDLF